MKNDPKRNYELMWETSHIQGLPEQYLKTINSDIANILKKDSLEEQDLVSLLCANKALENNKGLDLGNEKENAIWIAHIKLFKQYEREINRVINSLADPQKHMYEKIQKDYEAAKMQGNKNKGLNEYLKAHPISIQDTDYKNTFFRTTRKQTPTEYQPLFSESDKKRKLIAQLNSFIDQFSGKTWATFKIDVVLAGKLVTELQKRDKSINDVFSQVDSVRKNIKEDSKLETTFSFKDSMSKELQKIVNEAEDYVAKAGTTRNYNKQ